VAPAALKFMGAPAAERCDDNTLSSVLVVLDRFKRGVLGNSAKRDDPVQARILAQPASAGVDEPSASLVDLLQG